MALEIWVKFTVNIGSSNIMFTDGTNKLHEPVAGLGSIPELELELIPIPIPIPGIGIAKELNKRNWNWNW